MPLPSVFAVLNLHLLTAVWLRTGAIYDSDFCFPY
jgi:hypothetical protein